MIETKTPPLPNTDTATPKTTSPPEAIGPAARETTSGATRFIVGTVTNPALKSPGVRRMRSSLLGKLAR